MRTLAGTFPFMQTFPFIKMNGAGNDFVVLDNRSRQIRLDGAAIARLCDRHRGVGADGLLMVEPADAPDAADFRMRYYNADGGEAEMCGNGARCFARFAGRLAVGENGRSSIPAALNFQTQAGLIRAQLDGESVRLDMSRPTDGADLGGLRLPDGRILAPAYFLNTGVPHVVALVAEVEGTDVHTLGRAIRYHARFTPRGTNANFVQAVSRTEIVLRTYERGVEGETLACGTGATAAALVQAELNGWEGTGTIAVNVRSGDTLHVSFERIGPFQFERVTLGGPAEFVFSGEVAL